MPSFEQVKAVSALIAGALILVGLLMSFWDEKGTDQ